MINIFEDYVPTAPQDLYTSGTCNSEPSAHVIAQPSIELDFWDIYRIQFSNGSTSSHVVGISNDELRVTSPVDSVDPFTQRITTKRGSVYLLGKEAGNGSQCKSQFKVWLKIKGATKAFNVSSEMLFVPV